MATFYIEAVENTQIALVMVGSPTIGTVKYGVNDSTCPNTYTVTTESTPISLTAGQKCYWTITSTSTNFSDSNYLKFTSTAKINVGGNMSDLIGGESKIPRAYCFYGLFDNCTNLVSASNLVLVNDFNSKGSCYRNMFQGCTSLTTVPALSATTLTNYCYGYMFNNCTSLTTAPALPATTLVNYCYRSMFQGCTSLTTPPTLPATTLRDSCYGYMFNGCTSLTTAPALPATTLVNYCYQYMFQGCTSLTTPPTLPATTLGDGCYQYMFYGCTSLTTAPELPATTLTNGCYYYMFQGCTSLTTAPELPATTLETYCYRQMFYGCTNIKLSETQTAPYSIPYRIPTEGTGTEGTSSLDDMFSNTGGIFTGTPTINTTYYLAPYATFYIEAVEDTDITLSKVGTPTVGDAYYGVENHNVPNAYTYGDTIHLTAGQKCYWFVTSTTTDFSDSDYLRFASIAKINVGGNLSDLIGGESKIPRAYCFYGLFRSCTELVDASNLVLVNDFNSKGSCYGSMFYGCTSLTTAPELPATTLADSCYQYMFRNCTSLTIAPELPATTLANNCYRYMFRDCTSLTTAPELPATTLANYCYYYMFQGCTSLTTLPALPATTLADYCYNFMFYGCTNIKLSQTQTAPYLFPYRIPSEGTGTVGTSSLSSMFLSTGGTFKGTPTINTTYYLVPYATFYIEAVEDTDITLSKVGTPTVGDAYYGVKDHNVPNAYTYGDTIHLTAGQKCYWFITSTSADFSDSDYLNFTSTAKINVGGNMSDLIGGDTKIPRNYCFYALFTNCEKLVSASNLVLVNDFNNKTHCYYDMFRGCTSLTTPPELPATALATSCYRSMFYGCTSLTIPPELPATTLTDRCYSSMFNGCTNIKLSETQTAPYLIPYRIPSEGTGVVGTSSLSSMFTSTGGTFAGTPTINKTYYLVPYATFYIEAVEDTDITLSKVGTPTVGDACYGINNHGVSNVYNYGDTIHLTAGQKCYWFITSTSTDFSTSNYLKFTSTAKINVGGNLSDLIGGESKIPRNYCFCKLFDNCTNLVSASNLVVVNNFNSKNYCYYRMFYGCTSLTTPPALPATTLTSYCYQQMFWGCTSLTIAPELPATTLTDFCYNSMFSGCKSLTTAPELPATTLASNCYNSMFWGCTSLTIAPELPATTLAAQCYQSMFASCTSLTTPPALPATTLVIYCYQAMFSGCFNIKLSETQTAPYSIPYRIPSEETGTEGTNSLTDMFSGTGGTFTGTPTINTTYYLAPYATFYIEAVENTDITLSKFGTPTVGDTYYGINNHNVPNAYTYGGKTIHLTAGQKCYWFITSTSTDFSGSNYLSFSSTAKINVGGNLSDLIGGDTKIPRNYCFYNLFMACTKLIDASNLVLVNDFNSKRDCYSAMFYHCSSLTTPPALPATTLTTQCYYCMFEDCTSLTTAPELPATTLKNQCYGYMFNFCTSLTTPPELPATILDWGCYRGMFKGCTSFTTPPELPATKLAEYCYEEMLKGCTNVKLSETQTAPYYIPYRIPSEGVGTAAGGALSNMFTDTGGTFIGTPTINKTYYLVPYATFYIEAVEDTDITLSKVGSPTVGDACYGIDDHSVSNVYNYGDTIHLTAGQKCYWFVTSTSDDFSTSNYLKFTSTKKINVGGNMSDLIGGESKIPRNYCFYGLFYNCAKLVSASDLTLVNDFNSKTYCYYSMFYNCTSLTTAPALPAITLAEDCYANMFNGCTSLTTAPELPATTLAFSCYNSMFYNCTSLTTAPELPAITLANSCYNSMFYNCTSLTTAPELPAITLASSCYYNMFYGCTNIKLSETQTTPYLIPYRIPTEGTGTVNIGSLTNMFTDTGGTFKGTPTINKTYYLAPPSSPIYITYKGQELANFESGSKTIKCGGKYMEGDVIIAREIGTNNVVVLYNSGTILTFQNGTKTLKCAGKGMATDLVIQTS